MDHPGASPLSDPARLAARLARAREAQRQAEDIAERATRDLYQAHELLGGQYRMTLQALSALSQVTAATIDFQGVEQAIADSCPVLFGAKIAQVWTDDPVARVLRPTATAALDAHLYEAMGVAQVLDYDRSLGGAVFLSRAAIFVRDVQRDPRFAHPGLARDIGLRACGILPLIAGPQALGVLFIMFDSEHDFGVEEKKLMGLVANYAAFSLQRVRLTRELERSYEHLQATQAQLVQVQKMEAVGRVAGGLAHDFNNLLAIILGRSEILQSRLAPETAAHDDANVISETAERGAAITRQLLSFTRRHPARLEALDVNAVLRRLVPMLRPALSEQVELRVFAGDSSSRRVSADKAQLEQALLNLVLNSRDAMPAGGRLTISAEPVEPGNMRDLRPPDLPPGSYVRLTVADTGTGMDDATRARAFEPFFTTKEAGGGTGLGLATVYGFVKQHGGHIELTSAAGRGTTVAIWLPAIDAAHAGEAGLATAGDVPDGSEVILLAEDETEILRLVTTGLKARGYTVLEALTPTQALEIAREPAGPIHLLLTDVIMPEMSGRDLARRIRYLRPDIKVLYMSGYADEVLRLEGPDQGEGEVLRKPFRLETLARAVRNTLDAPTRT